MKHIINEIQHLFALVVKSFETCQRLKLSKGSLSHHIFSIYFAKLILNFLQNRCIRFAVNRETLVETEIGNTESCCKICRQDF